MNVKEQLTPLEFLASISPPHFKAPPKTSPPTSPRFKQYKYNETFTHSQIRRSQDVTFEVLRSQDRRATAEVFQNRDLDVVKPRSIPLIGRQFSNEKANQNPNFRDLATKLEFWKSSVHKQQEINLVNEIKSTLLLVEKTYKESCCNDSEKRVSFPAFYFLDSILRTIYAIPSCKKILMTDENLKLLFCRVNYLIRDYRSIVAEALSILNLVKKHRKAMEKVLCAITKKQIEIIEGFSYVPFVRDLAKEIKSTNELFKCGILKEKDIEVFFQSINLNGSQSLDKNIAIGKMIDMILNPNEAQMVYGPFLLPIRNAFSKENLKPLRKIADMFSEVETKLEIIEDEKYEENLVIASKPMGKIKELLKIAMDELISHQLIDLPKTEQEHFRSLLKIAFPSAQKEKKRNWSLAFEIFSELKKLHKERKKITKPVVG